MIPRNPLRALAARTRWRTARRAPVDQPAPPEPAAPTQRRYVGPWRTVVLVDPAHPHRRVVGACDFFDPAEADAYAALITEHAPHLALTRYTVDWGTEPPDPAGWWIDSAEQVVTGVLSAPELWVNFPPPTPAPPG